jgi:sulfite exporter TauE/SafE
VAGWVEYTLVATFLAGLGSGAHCAAMCGPLLGAACGARATGTGRTAWVRNALAYNMGRVTSYCVAGALTGALGAAGLAWRGGPAAQQLVLALMSASLVLIAGYVAGFTGPVRAVERAGAMLWRRIEPGARRFLPADTPGRAFGLGLVWGWLPCGMVYAALIAALASGDPLHGAALMAAFGLGTIPSLLALSAALRHLPLLARARAARVLFAVVIAAIGLAGMMKAAHPSVISPDGSWCLQIPGLGAVLGGGSSR